MRSSFNQLDLAYMDRAIQLAKLGGTQVKTNPNVGAVIVHNQTIIGEGWHEYFGGPHAEVNALKSVQERDLQKLKDSTIYLTLEPCNHHGKTPPCVEAIIQNKIPRVVIGTLDPNPQMAGSSIRILEAAGIEVCMSERIIECKNLIEKFSVQQAEKRPFITLKWAETFDGFIGSNTERLAISHPLTQFWTHRLRSERQAIWVGKNTLVLDNPHLDIRKSTGMAPTIIVLDRKGDLPKNLKIFKAPENILYITENHNITDLPANVSMHYIYPQTTLSDILREIYANGIGSILVEGGAVTIEDFYKQNLWDECFKIQSPKRNERANIKAPSIHNSWLLLNQIVSDLIFLKKRKD